MLRKGIVVLMIAVMGVASVNAGDTSGQDRPGVMSWLRRQADTSGGRQPRPKGSTITHAVVADAERQAPGIRQTSNEPQPVQPQPGMAPLQPLPIQYAPAVPNTSSVSGPQYYSATSNGHAVPVHPGRNWQQYNPPAAVYETSAAPFRFASSSAAVSTQSGYADPYMSGDAGSYGSNSPMMGAPHTGAALYPAPIPGIPQQVGGTVIPTQAFHPHEMLYAHRYKAMYPPYYYKVNGGWMVTPWGVWSHEDWKLQGTTVDVKYKSYISPFAHFKPPIIR